MRKILQRGDTPPPDPDSERQLLASLGSPETLDSLDPGDLAVELEDPSILPRGDQLLGAARWSSSDFAPERSFALDSAEEWAFVEIAHNRLGPAAARWLHPQARLDDLVTGRSIKSLGHRRVDFLFSPPWKEPVVLEIDGQEHDEDVDDARDELLLEASIPVVRIPVEEVRTGRGPKLEEALQELSLPSAPDPDFKTLGWVYGPWISTQLGLALAEALDQGWLTGSTWTLEIHDPLGLARHFLRSHLELLSAIGHLYEESLGPELCLARFNASDAQALRIDQVGEYRSEEAAAESQAVDLTIKIEPDRGAFDELPPHGETPTVLMRSCSLPLHLAEGRIEATSRRKGLPNSDSERALQRVARFVFAKKSFREGQFEALSQVLKSRDCAVLLPTGAGKSLIYQLAGLIQPGRTLVIDPIVALMEDQVRSLHQYGINRATAISSFVTKTGELDAAFEAVRSGAALFFFVSPERLQQIEFRQTLKTLAMGTPINLAVVDEAHCVSEWGHDFRPAYLNLGPVIRKHCADALEQPPPLLALTGTASRAVLRDVLIELDIDQRDAKAIIKPDTFDRPELRFEVRRCTPSNSHSALVGYIQALPGQFNEPPQTFFAARGRRSHLGIVFCPWVNGDYGIANVRPLLDSQLKGLHGASWFSGSAPKTHRHGWEHEKRHQAERFKRGEAPVMVSTKAFGMGIDIPNVRYVVHFGIPASVEAYYQEAGRAGRDRQPSQCTIILCENDEEVSRELLAEDFDGDRVREKFKELEDKLPKSQRNDVLRQLFFHFNSFPGVEAEAAEVDELMQLLDWTGEQINKLVPFGKAEEPRERAIYRLALVGVVTDYCKDWGSKSFEIWTRRADTEALDRSFLRYVRRVQPGRVADLRSQVDALPEQTPRERSLALARMVLEFLYDTIERARRRALREMWLLALHGRDDASIRGRIDQYFHEGALAPRLEALVSDEQFDAPKWLDLLSSLTVQDSGELRGTTARFLESYPDQPGLLVGRAFAELLARGDRAEWGENLKRAFGFGKHRYSLSWEQLELILDLLLHKCWDTEPSWAVEAWLAWEAAEEQEPQTTELEITALGREEQTAGEAIVLLPRQLDDAYHLAERIDRVLTANREQSDGQR